MNHIKAKIKNDLTGISRTIKLPFKSEQEIKLVFSQIGFGDDPSNIDVEAIRDYTIDSLFSDYRYDNMLEFNEICKMFVDCGFDHIKYYEAAIEVLNEKLATDIENALTFTRDRLEFTGCETPEGVVLRRLMIGAASHGFDVKTFDYDSVNVQQLANRLKDDHHYIVVNDEYVEVIPN